MSLLKAEGAAADEDEDTQADQNNREQHMLPAFENLRDRWTGCLLYTSPSPRD